MINKRNVIIVIVVAIIIGAVVVSGFITGKIPPIPWGDENVTGEAQFVIKGITNTGEEIDLTASNTMSFVLHNGVIIESIKVYLTLQALDNTDGLIPKVRAVSDLDADPITIHILMADDSDPSINLVFGIPIIFDTTIICVSAPVQVGDTVWTYPPTYLEAVGPPTFTDECTLTFASTGTLHYYPMDVNDVEYPVETDPIVVAGISYDLLIVENTTSFVWGWGGT